MVVRTAAALYEPNSLLHMTEAGRTARLPCTSGATESASTTRRARRVLLWADRAASSSMASCSACRTLSIPFHRRCNSLRICRRIDTSVCALMESGGTRGCHLRLHATHPPVAPPLLPAQWRDGRLSSRAGRRHPTLPKNGSISARCVAGCCLGPCKAASRDHRQLHTLLQRLTDREAW